MGKLPRYNSQGNTTTQRPSAMRSVESETQIGRAVSGMGSAIKEVNNVYQQAKNFSETLENKNRVDMRKREIIEASKRDQDHRNKEVYQDELDKLGDSVGEFSDNLARLEFDKYVQSQINQGQIQLDGDFNIKELNWTVANIDTQGDSNLKKYTEGDLSAFDVQKNVVAMAWNDGKGLLTPKKYEEKTPDKQDWDYQRALHDAQINPENADWKVENGHYDLRPEDRAKYIKESKRVKKERTEEETYQNELVSTQSAMELAGKLANGTLTMGDIDIMVQKKKIKPKEAQAFMASFSAMPVELSDSEIELYYVGLLEALEKPEDGAKDVIMKASKAFNQGVMKLQEYSYFLQVANDMYIEQEKKESNKQATAWNSVGSGLVGLASSAGTFPYKQFFGYMINGMDKKVAMQKTVNDTLTKLDPSLYTSEDPVEDYYKKQAVKILQKNGYPIDKTNVDALVAQSKAFEASKTKGEE